MSQDCVLTPVAFIHTEFPAKFGIPRQAGLAEELRGKIVFEPAYRVDEALRGLEGFSHIWLIWGFSENRDRGWTPTVRPPRLGGNTRLGVFATRSPFRPNGLGLSCVRLVGMQKEDGCGTCLLVAGADLMDGTPIYDIKPYLPYADCRTEAVGGFAPEMPDRLEVLHRTRGRRIRRIRSGSTACPLPAWKSAFGWKGGVSRSWPSIEGKSGM